MFEDEMGNVKYENEKTLGCCAKSALGCFYCYKLCRSSCCQKKPSKAKPLIPLPRAPVNFKTLIKLSNLRFMF